MHLLAMSHYDFALLKVIAWSVSAESGAVHTDGERNEAVAKL
jgi:hypothetical protein